MNKSKKYFIITETALGILVLILAVMMLGGRDRDTIGRVSVIIRDSDDAQWAAFKYGIRKAAQERGVEAVVVGTESVLTLEEEKELIEAEIDNGADAVIVQPVPEQGAEEMLEKIKKKVPVMLVGSHASADGGDSALPVTEASPYELGAALAEEILKDYSRKLEGKTLGIVSWTTDSVMTAERMEGFTDTLEGTGVTVSWHVAGKFDGGEEAYLGAQAKVDVIAALDDSSLTAAGEYWAEENGGVPLYGIGHSTQAAYYLDKGIVECLVMPDEFSVGYQSMSEIANSLEELFYKTQDRRISYTVLRRESLFSQKGQEILFTMSQ